MMECKFVVNQKVVCIVENSAWRVVVDIGLSSVLPLKDNIYTVHEVEMCLPINKVVLVLKEFGENFSFAANCFRPLQDKPKEAATDISVFYPLLQSKELEKTS